MFECWCEIESLNGSYRCKSRTANLHCTCKRIRSISCRLFVQQAVVVVVLYAKNVSSAAVLCLRGLGGIKSHSHCVLKAVSAMLYTVHPPATTSAVDRDAVAQRFPACTLYNICCGPESGKRSDLSVKAADLPGCGEQTSCRRSRGLCGLWAL